MTDKIKVMSISLDHKGGTKSYHLMVISNTETGAAVFLTRWGRTGQFGEIQVVLCKGETEAVSLFIKKEREKYRGGYASNGPSRSKVADSVVEAVSIPIFSKMGPDAILHLDPSADVSGVRERDMPRTNEDGKLTGADVSRKADITAALDAEKLRLKTEIAQSYENNPVFGSF